MESVFSGCTGIDTQHSMGLIVLHLEDMRMAANEELSGFSLKHTLHRWREIAVLKAYMRKHNVDLLRFPTLHISEHKLDVTIVDIALYCSRGLEITQQLQHLGRADIACVPYLIYICKMLKHALVEQAVGI